MMIDIWIDANRHRDTWMTYGCGDETMTYGYGNEMHQVWVCR